MQPTSLLCLSVSGQWRWKFWYTEQKIVDLPSDCSSSLRLVLHRSHLRSDSSKVWLVLMFCFRRVLRLKRLLLQYIHSHFLVFFFRGDGMIMEWQWFVLEMIFICIYRDLFWEKNHIFHKFERESGHRMFLCICCECKGVQLLCLFAPDSWNTCCCRVF